MMAEESYSLGGLYSATKDLVYTCVDTFMPERKLPIEPVVVIKEVTSPPLDDNGGRIFIRLAGLSGAAAVMLGIYGSHVFREQEQEGERSGIVYTYNIGNRYHFIHTLALLAVPNTSYPWIVGNMLIGGMILFSGSCYVHALTGKDSVRRATPYGGILLIAAWLAMIL